MERLISDTLQGVTETSPVSPTSATHPRWHTVVAALGVVLLALIVFLPTLRYQFVSFDDADNIFDNPYLNPVNAQTLPRFWGESYYELYTPVTYSLWAAVAALPAAHLSKPVAIPGAGQSLLSAAAFHAEGVLFHSLNSLLLFLVLVRLPFLRGRSPIYAALGAALWAVHPLQAEPVSWVTGNNNVFSGTFMLLALLAFCRRLEARSDREVLGWYLLATVCYALALLAKPTAAALPLVAFALAVGAYRQSWRSLLLPLGAWLCLAGGFLFVTRNTASPVTDVSLPLWQRPFVVGDALAFYAGKIILPIHLGLDYGRQPEWLRTQPWFYAMWLIPVGLALLLLQWYRRSGRSETPCAVLTGFAMFVVGALPMLGLAPYYFHRYSTVADRYVYLALIGIAVIFAAVAAALEKRYSRAVVVGASVLIVAFAAQCQQQSHVWRDSRSLYHNAIRVNPVSMMGHYNLTAVYQAEGDDEQIDQQLELAAASRPAGAELPATVQMKIGNRLYARGETEQATAAYQKGIRLNPDFPQIRAQLAVLYWESGNNAAAQATIADALKSARNPVESAYTLGSTLLSKGASELGLPLLEQTAQTKDDRAADACYVLAIWYLRNGNQERATGLMLRAVELRPDWQEAQAMVKQLTGK